MACPHCSGTRFCLCNGPVPVSYYAKYQDRAARIRALAERMFLADLSGPHADGGHLRAHARFRDAITEDARHWFANATVMVDELDRLEREEREKGGEK